MTQGIKMAIPTKQEFLDACNGTGRKRRRERIFDSADYISFVIAVKDAIKGRWCPFYRSSNAGGVANSYGYFTKTSFWGVWTTRDGKVCWDYGTKPVCSRHVRCAYYGGQRTYLSHYKNDCVKSNHGIGADDVEANVEALQCKG